MKLTLIRKDQKNQMYLTMKTVEAFIERIKTDTKSGDVAGLRRHLAGSTRDFGYSQMYRLPVVYPMAELTRDANDNLVMGRMNGVVLLTIGPVRVKEAQSSRILMTEPLSIGQRARSRMCLPVPLQ